MRLFRNDCLGAVINGRGLKSQKERERERERERKKKAMDGLDLHSQKTPKSSVRVLEHDKAS